MDEAAFDESVLSASSRLLRLNHFSGWWMRRIPKAGDLRAYLDQAALDGPRRMTAAPTTR